MKLILLSLVFLCTFPLGAQQVIGFEDRVPDGFTSPDRKSLSLSNRYYKEGKKSLEWNFGSGSVMNVALDAPLALNNKTEATHGITLWIYNEKSQPDSLRFEFLDAEGKVSYWFTYRLQSPGWRACWIGFKSMRGDKADKSITSYRIVAPNRKGRVFFDRWKFPEKAMNLRTTPDMQIDYNSLAVGRDLWHWCRVWEWEQYEYDIPRPAKLTEQQRRDLKTIEERLNEALTPPAASAVTAAVKKPWLLMQRPISIRRVRALRARLYWLPTSCIVIKANFLGMTLKPCLPDLPTMLIVTSPMRPKAITLPYGSMR